MIRLILAAALSLAIAALMWLVIAANWSTAPNRHRAAACARRVPPWDTAECYRVPLH